MLYASCYENNNGSSFTKQEWSITKTWIESIYVETNIQIKETSKHHIILTILIILDKQSIWKSREIKRQLNEQGKHRVAMS